MMKKYYIKLKKNQHSKLIDVIKKHLNLDHKLALKTITQGSVWSGNSRLKDEKLLIKDELLTVYFPEFPIYEYTLDAKDIIFEDEYFIVVNKPSGINTNQSPFSDIDCLSYGVQKYYDDKKIDYRVNVINRLDKPTSGLVFFAKNKEVEISLHKFFNERKIKKLYLAITPKFELSKNSFLIKDTLEWRGKTKEAISFIEFVKEKDKKLFFTIYPMTGRTHQIRKHFKKYLRPIIGDALYGNYGNKERLELYCIYYKFNHPITGEVVEIKHIPDEYRCD